MTKKEFNQYLESIGGLVRAWKPEKGPILTSDFFEISEGWFPLVKNLIDELIAIGWDKNVTQVKEKFGGLRFYIEIPTESPVEPKDIYKIISKYEKLSYYTCEKCGNEGKLRTNGWHTTLCDEHNE